MALDPEIAVRVGADITALKRELSKGKRTLKGFEKEIKAGAKNFAKFGGAATAAGAALAVGIVKNSLAAIDAQAKLAKQIKSSTVEVETLERAGSLAGVTLKEITNASLKLEINAGKAAQGLVAQKRAFDAMGVSAQEIMKLPLTERFTAINKAIAENVERTEQAAVASDIFGAKNASLIRLLDADTIARAAEETRLFGTALETVDAAKIENANDAMGSFQLAAEGVSKQLTVKLSPYLQKAGEDFKKAIKEGGGMGDVVGNAVNMAIKALGFLLDAVEGVKRVFQIAGKTIAMFFGAVLSNVQQKVADVAKMLDKVTPGDVFKSLAVTAQAQANTTRDIIGDLQKDIADILNEPLPSHGLQQWKRDAEAAGNAAAEAAAKAKDALNGTGEDAGEQVDPLDDMLAEFDREAQITDMQFAEVDKRKKKAQEEKDARVQAGKDALSNLTSLMDSENKKQFKIGKAAAISQAAVSTVASAQEAFKALAGIPVVGPALGAAAAAAALAAGKQRISSIKSQSFGSSSVGGGGGGGGQAQAPAAVSQSAPETRQINITGVNPSDFVQVGGLVEQINEELGNGANLNINFAG